jgi:hypothetical protein
MSINTLVHGVDQRFPLLVDIMEFWITDLYCFPFFGNPASTVNRTQCISDNTLTPFLMQTACHEPFIFSSS